jgi:transposase
MATKVESFEQIRRDSWREGLSVRALARKYGVHRRLVRDALMHAEPAPRKTPERRSPRLDPFRALIDGWLRADLDAPRKQRHTATRIHARLLDEHEAGDVSYAAVRDYVARRRPEVRIEEGRGPARVFIPQHHPPGLEAEVDFGELWVRLAGVVVKCYLFAFRMSYSGRAVHLVSATCGQEAFLEGHVHAFTVLGGVPAGQIRYDNLTAAVTKVLRKGRVRIENRGGRRSGPIPVRGVLLRARHRGSPREGRRRGPGRVLPPQSPGPGPGSGLARGAERADRRRRGGRGRPADRGADPDHRPGLRRRVPLLVPLPEEPFETGLLLTPRVDRYSQVTVRMSRYSVPVRLIGRQVRVVLRSTELVIYDGRHEAARHERMTARGGEALVLDHYLEALMRKPGALAGSVPLEQARAAGAFTGAHEALWSAARRASGEPAATRVLVEVLLLHRHMDAADVITGIEAALSVGAHAADVVAVEARRAADARAAGPVPDSEPPDVPQVTSLTLRRLAALPADSRPLPTVSAYDQLLTRPRTTQEGQS